jgi:signal transduction histidine kinase
VLETLPETCLDVDDASSNMSKAVIKSFKRRKPLTEDPDQTLHLSFELTIQDFGCGMKPEQTKNLFLNFSKIKESCDRNPYGVGLGLSICKKLIQMMGGKVEV